MKSSNQEQWSMRPIKLRTETPNHPTHHLCPYCGIAYKPRGSGRRRPHSSRWQATTYSGWPINQLQGEGGQGFQLEEERTVCECRKPDKFYKLYVSSVRNDCHSHGYIAAYSAKTCSSPRMQRYTKTRAS